MLRAPFLVRALSHCRQSLKIKWKDGARSEFPNSWLRSSVRDPKFFEPISFMYHPEHLAFVAQAAPIHAVHHQEGDRNISVEWEDHTSSFDASWLRAQDSRIYPTDLPRPLEEVNWDSTATMPEYEFSEKESKFESWVLDLKRMGAILVHGVPPTEQGITDFLQMIAPLRQRYHPTNIFTLQAGAAKAVEIDHHAYRSSFLGAHTDSAEYPVPAKVEAFLSVQYSAPIQDTISFVVDGFKVLRDLKAEDPETFEILSTTSIQVGRHRLDVEEPCDPKDVRMYEWDTCVPGPILTIKNGKFKQLRFRHNKHIGLPLAEHDEGSIHRFYHACQTLQERLDDPRNHLQFILKPGVMIVFDNHRVCHGRLEIHPNTIRKMYGAYIADESWHSRWRLILGKWSGLEDKWLYGCSDEGLEILSQRIEKV